MDKTVAQYVCTHCPLSSNWNGIYILWKPTVTGSSTHVHPNNSDGCEDFTFNEILTSRTLNRARISQKQYSICQNIVFYSTLWPVYKVVNLVIGSQHVYVNKTLDDCTYQVKSLPTNDT